MTNLDLNPKRLRRVEKKNINLHIQRSSLTLLPLNQPSLTKIMSQQKQSLMPSVDLPYPNELLPEIQMSLGKFVTRATSILDQQFLKQL